MPIRWVLVRDPEGPFASQALLCPNQSAQAVQIGEWVVMRWPMEVTFHEVRTHLGGETQRQWSDLAILRTTPALLGLFSLVTLFAHHWWDGQPFPVRQAAWYAKALPTFSDPLAFVRQHLWPSTFFVCRLPKRIWCKFHRRFSTALSIRSLSRLDEHMIWIKSSYGDYYPVITLGRTGAVILMFFGLGIIGVLSSYLSTTFISLERRRRAARKHNDEEKDDEEKDNDDSTSRDAELAAIREELAALRKLFEEHYHPQ